MIKLRVTVATAAGLLLAAMVPGVSSAQSRGNYRSYHGEYVPFPQVNVPFNSRDIGIPGPPRTCVKWCEEDMNPCDPPSYKTADGRCNSLD